jgi:hypothetical protein
MRLARYGLVAVVSSAITVAVLATGGLATDAKVSRTFVAKPGDNVHVPSVDLFCTVMGRDPDRHEAGAIVMCNRYSVDSDSRSTSASKFHYWFSDPSGDYIARKVSRSP